MHEKYLNAPEKLSEYINVDKYMVEQSMDKLTKEIDNILQEQHCAIMTKSVTVDEGLKQLYERVSEVEKQEAAGWPSLEKGEPMRMERYPVKNKRPLARKKALVAYSFILPNLIGFLIFTLIPIVFLLLLSFCEWDSRNPIRFVVFKNFITMFTKDSSFRIALKNTLYYTW